MLDFVIYFCGHGNTKDYTVISLDKLHTHTKYRFETRYIPGDALIGRSRSRACTQFLWCDDSPYMIFIDTDIVFEPEHIEKIYRSLQAGYPIAAGAYSVATGTHLAIRTRGAIAFDNQIKEVEYASTGFMGVSRVALKQIKKKLDLPLLHKGEWCECYPFFECGRYMDEKIYISEDWDFCNKARQAGLKVYVHTGALVGHVKDRVIWANEVLNRMVKEEHDTKINIVQETLYDDLAEFTGEDKKDVFNKAHEASSILAEKWKEYEGNDFYRETKEYAYDLAAFNVSAGYWQTRMQPLATSQGLNVLDFGCGIGSAAFWMGFRRNKVVGYDINPYCIEFAEFRNKKFGLANVSFTQDEPDYSQFDLVVAIDALEHIEDLESLIKKFGTMKKGAKLYHSDAFQLVGNHPMHFDHSKNIDKWLEEAGFATFDKQWAIKA